MLSACGLVELAWHMPCCGAIVPPNDRFARSLSVWLFAIGATLHVVEARADDFSVDLPQNQAHQAGRPVRIVPSADEAPRDSPEDVAASGTTGADYDASSEAPGTEVPGLQSDSPPGEGTGEPQVRWSWPRYRLGETDALSTLAPNQAGTEATLAASRERTPAHVSENRPAQPPPTRLEWYGDTNFALDGLAILTSPLLVGIGVYLVGPPMVHYRHGRTGRMIGSFALRVGVPVFAIAGLGGEMPSSYAGFLVVGVATALPAMLVDDIALSWARVPVTEVAEATVFPSLVVERLGVRAGVAGTF